MTENSRPADPDHKIVLQCREVRIGTYKCVPKKPVLITPKGIQICVSPKSDPETECMLNFVIDGIAKILIHFGNELPVIFVYAWPELSEWVCRRLGMDLEGKEPDYYYCSTSNSHIHRRLVILPVEIPEDAVDKIKAIFAWKLNLLSRLVANDMLSIIINYDEIEKDQNNSQRTRPSNSQNSVTASATQHLLTYPRSGEGGISINTEDYSCLAPENSRPADPDHKIVLQCREVRIGTYKCVPKKPVLITPKGIQIFVSPKSDPETECILNFVIDGITKISIHFGNELPVIFVYAWPELSEWVCRRLGMDLEGKEPDYYYCSTSNSHIHSRLVILPVEIPEDAVDKIKAIFAWKLNLLSRLDANDILSIIINYDEIEKDQNNSQRTRPSNSQNSVTASARQHLLTYPRSGEGGISINTEDYSCLATDQLVNDVIIDFYLKYFVENCLPEDIRQKTHVFSTSFYKCLTCQPPGKNNEPNELARKFTLGQRRHMRVERWTRNFNLFDKDYIIIPITKSSHCFLAIICFPGLDGCHEIRDPKKAPVKGKKSQVKKEKQPEVEEKVKKRERTPREPVRQPCILIFDSLARGPSKTRVVATLRNYLTWEYRAIYSGSNRIFNGDNMRGHRPKVPQHNNYTDCGLYVLQYVESFFFKPIKDYRIPITHLKDWFEEIVVTKKREELAALIRYLMSEYGLDVSKVPVIKFPTINGMLIEDAYDHCEDEEEDDEEELMDES